MVLLLLTYTDPVSLVRGVQPTLKLFFAVEVGREDPNTTICRPSLNLAYVCHVNVCHAFLSVHCSRVVTCWERTGLFGLLYVMLYCVFVTFACDVLDQVWYLIESIPDLCLHTYCGSFMVFKGSGPVLLRNLIFFVIFHGGGPPPSSGSAHF